MQGFFIDLLGYLLVYRQHHGNPAGLHTAAVGLCAAYDQVCAPIAVQGSYSDLLVYLSNVYSEIRGDQAGQKNEDSAQGFVRSTTKYWVRTDDATQVKHHILQHLPVFQYATVGVHAWNLCQAPQPSMPPLQGSVKGGDWQEIYHPTNCCQTLLLAAFVLR